MNRIVIAGASVYGLQNHSDDAMLNVFCRELHANIPDLEIILLARHPNKAFDELYGVRSIKNLDHSNKKESLGRWFRGLNPGDSTDHLKEVWKAIESSDLLVIGGDPFIEISLGFYRGLVPYTALLITMAKFLQKPVMLHGIHLGRPPKSELGIELTRFCLSNADLITLREASAKKRLLEFVISDKNSVSLADTAWGLDPIEGKELGQQILDKEGIRFKSEKVVGITLRHMYWKWSVSDWDYYSAILADTCDYIIEQLGVDLLCIPNCTYDIDHKYEDDRTAANDIVNKMKRKEHAHRITNKYTLFETLSLYRHLDMVFANRRHCLIFAAVQGIPSIVCGEELHVKPVMDELGLGDKFIGVEELNADLLKKNISETWDNREQIAKSIKLALPGLRKKALQHGKLAADLIKEKAGGKE